MQFLMNSIDQLIGKGLSEWVILQFIILNIAWMVVLAAPMAVLFSTLMSFGSMSAAHEVTIVKASGGSLLRMMTPVVIAGFLLSIALFYFNDIILPEANHRTKVLMSDIKRKKPTFSLEKGRFSTELEGYTILARSIDSSTGMLRGVTIYDNRRADIINIISSDTGYVGFASNYEKLILTLYRGEIHQLNPNNVINYRKVLFRKYKIGIPATGFAFERSSESMVSRGDREMRIIDMKKIVDEAAAAAQTTHKRLEATFEKHIDFMAGRINTQDSTKPSQQPVIARSMFQDTATGLAMNRIQSRLTFLRQTIQSDVYQEEEFIRRARQYEVEIYKKYAIPFACFIFVFVGCPLGIITRGGNFGISAGISLLFYLIYWACLIGGEKLADRGFLSTWLSMWLGNIIVGTLGILLTIRVNNESFGLLRIKRFFYQIYKNRASG